MILRPENGLHLPERSGGWRAAAEELAALHETTIGLIERLDLSSVLGAIVERAGALVGTSHGYLYLVDPDHRSLVVEVGTGMFHTNVGYRVRRGEGLAGQVWETGEPVLVDDYRRWSNRRHDLRAMPLGAVIGVPLRTGGGVAGVLGLSYVDPARRFGRTELALLRRFAQLASLALENARLYGAAKDELLERRRTEEELLDAVARLERSRHDLHLAHGEMIRRLAFAAEFRDDETGRHTERMSRYCEFLGRRIGLDDERCELVRAASPLHDIGKIAVPDGILLKPGALTTEERSLMQRHAEIGNRLLRGSSSELLELAATIAWTHHERYDGSGYPRGLSGDRIPLEGRIASVADVFDALTTDRVYRPAFALDRALALMQAGRGTQFDPLILDLFLDCVDELELGLSTRSGEATAGAGAEKRTSGSLALPESERDPQPSPICPDRLKAACAAALESLSPGLEDRQAIDLVLARLREEVGSELLVSIYLLDHGRLWCVTQHGYGRIRDGFALDQGVMGRAVRTGVAQLIEDVAVDADFVAAVEGIHAELALPFCAADGARGLLNVETIGRRLPAESIEIFAPVVRALEARTGPLHAHLGVDVARLARLCVHASSLRGVGAIAEFATQTLARLLSLDSAQLALAAEDGGYRLASYCHRPESKLEPLSTAELRRLRALAQSSDAAFELVERADIDSPPLVWLPLRVGGSEIGVLVGSGDSSFPQEQIEAATLFAQHAAALLDVANALRREQRAASTDALTGLLNRRGFDARLREELERAERGGHELAVLMLDCDVLKTINDRGGHELGDAALERVAHCLRLEKRLGDAAARLGGDEFVVLLPETGGDAALAAAERLRKRLAAEELPGDAGIVTASFGAASFPESGGTAPELLRAADAALYRAKAAGRNRTVLAEHAAEFTRTGAPPGR